MTGERRDEQCPHEELAVGWAMHSLEPDEEARLRAHLPGCARCREAVRTTEEVTAALGGSLRQHEPPPHLKARLMAEIEHTPQQHVPARGLAAPRPQVSPQRTPPDRNQVPPGPLPQAPSRAEAPDTPPVSLTERRKARLGRRLLAAAAVVVALAAVGVAGVRVNQLGDQVTAQEQRNRDLTKALELAANPNTNRAVLRSNNGDPVAIMLSGGAEGAVMESKLAPNPTDEIYVMWGKSTPEAVPLATFTVKPGTTVQFLNWTEAAHQHKVFAISREKGTTAPATPTDVLASGQVGDA